MIVKPYEESLMTHGLRILAKRLMSTSTLV